MKALLTIVLATLALGLVACGGGSIPDDVEWNIINDYPGFDEGRNFNVQLGREVSEDTLAAISQKVKSQREKRNPRFNPGFPRTRGDRRAVSVPFHLHLRVPPHARG